MIMTKDIENVKDLHYVYEHKLDGKVIYVGKGTGYRAISPDRNVYWKALVGERVDEVNVAIKAYFEDEDDALMYESILIDRYVSENVKLTNINMNSNVYEDYSYLEETIKEMIDKEAKDKLERVMSLLTKKDTPIDVQILEREESVGSIKKRLNTPLDANAKNAMCKELNVRRESDGKIVKWTTISKVLINEGYIIKNSRKIVNGKQVRVSLITLRNDSEVAPGNDIEKQDKSK